MQQPAPPRHRRFRWLTATAGLIAMVTCLGVFSGTAPASATARGEGHLAAAATMTAVAHAGAAPGTQAAPAGRHPSWHLVRGPRLAPNNVLNDVAAVSKRLAWAGGVQGFTSNGSRPGRPLLARWSGRAWSVSALPVTWPGGIAAVSASSAADAWVLGQDASGRSEHMLRWNGRRWHRAPGPFTAGGFYGNLSLTSAPRGATWLAATQGGANAQIFAWAGAHWREQSYRCPGIACNLYQVTARTAGDAWAAGNYLTDFAHGSCLALHWAGRRWTATPFPYLEHCYLTSVFAVSKSSAWAVGFVFGTARALLYHWTNGSWHRVPAPAGLTQPALGEITQITGDPSGRLWICDFGLGAGDRAQYLRYDGRHWSMIDGPVSTTRTGILVRSVAVIPGTSDAWSVGLGMVAGNQARARIEFYA